MRVISDDLRVDMELKKPSRTDLPVDFVTNFERADSGRLIGLGRLHEPIQLLGIGSKYSMGQIISLITSYFDRSIHNPSACSSCRSQSFPRFSYLFRRGCNKPVEPKDQTWKKSQACKRCLRTIFEKIVDIFGQTINFRQLLPIKGNNIIYPHLIYLC